MKISKLTWVGIMWFLSVFMGTLSVWIIPVLSHLRFTQLMSFVLGGISAFSLLIGVISVYVYTVDCWDKYKAGSISSTKLVIRVSFVGLPLILFVGLTHDPLTLLPLLDQSSDASKAAVVFMEMFFLN